MSAMNIKIYIWERTYAMLAQSTHQQMFVNMTPGKAMRVIFSTPNILFLSHAWFTQSLCYSRQHPILTTKHRGTDTMQERLGPQRWAGDASICTLI